LYDALDSVEEVRVGALRFDLCAGGEGDEGVSASVRLWFWEGEEEMPYVRAMERIPPPAPLKAWATLSDC